MQKQLDNYLCHCLAQQSIKFKAMFGGIGLFYHRAMFVLIDEHRVYLRGGGALNASFERYQCVRYTQVKKTVRVAVDYYDVTEIFQKDRALFMQLEALAKHQSRVDKVGVKHKEKRIRDLPNMRLTLERMVTKSGVSDIESFRELGAVEVYRRVEAIYGQQVNDALLFKFAGALQGVHWQLLSDECKEELSVSLSRTHKKAASNNAADH
ncbi:TfoX/Sxy family DNA transformation protein [Vibrio ulleungensis]|uniref:TfoX/Sxy family DNA transformation protein n=1 Tax=Vibrio ulleungensis TaxID=2807619 RepID=A0ABS2HMX7_9VIBR|nr:TfoX/Sxy family DNA transformation protein [Vibrio ulleungensis]MBM7038426.1 TfoX/Sxy family DNA transformation protein [Vibrio ulleungensis]